MVDNDITTQNLSKQTVYIFSITLGVIYLPYYAFPAAYLTSPYIIRCSKIKWITPKTWEGKLMVLRLQSVLAQSPLQGTTSDMTFLWENFIFAFYNISKQY